MKQQIILDQIKKSQQKAADRRLKNIAIMVEGRIGGDPQLTVEILRTELKWLERAIDRATFE